jgi:hypothetical protein
VVFLVFFAWSIGFTNKEQQSYAKNMLYIVDLEAASC